MTWKRDNYVRGRYIVDAEVRRAKDAHRIVALAGLRARGYRGAFPLSPGLWGVEVVGYWPDGRHGDADRLLTLVLDAMEGVAYVADRAVKVAQVKVRQHDHPRVEVMLWRLDEPEEP